MTPEQIFGIAALVAGGLVAIAFHWRPEPSLDDLPEGDGERCVACGETVLLHPAPGLYECPACGFEGGAGRGEAERQERELAWSLKPWPERRDAALADLEEARLLLLAAHSELKYLAGYLEENDPFRSEINATWKRVALTAVDLLTDNDFGAQRPGEVLQSYHDELHEETEKAWGALRRAAEKVPELEAGPQPPYHPLAKDGAAGTGQSVNLVMRAYREMAERYRRAKDLLVSLDAERA